MADKKEVKLVAYAPFEFRRKQYKVDDVFVPPADTTRDLAFEEFRNIEKQGERNGVAFSEILPPMTPKGDPYVRRVILPLKEA